MSHEAKPKDERELERLETKIERTRSDMSTTIARLEERFEPSDLEARLKGLVHEELGEVRTILKEELREAKDAVNEVIVHTKDAVKEDVLAAKEAVKKDVKEAVAHAKEAARAATIGKLEDIATKAGDAMNTTRVTLIDTVRQNPIPAALVGVGIAWLLMNRSSSARTGATNGTNGHNGHAVGHALGAAGRKVVDVEHKLVDMAQGATGAVGDAIGDAADRTTRVAHDASQTASRAAHAVGTGFSSVAHAVPQQARRAEEALVNVFHDNALIVGAVVIAVGAMVGMSLPRTRSEDQLMGATRDHLLTEAQDLAHHAVDGLKEASDGASQRLQASMPAST